MIPAFVNDASGTAGKARAALEAAGAFDVQDVRPAELEPAIRGALARTPQPPRIAVAGGDGSVATAVGIVLGTKTELAIVPGGTLNHFARDHGIPLDLERAVGVAMEGRAESADVAIAGERVFINTSSVGAYVTFVRMRERFERYLGYRLASIVAALRLFLHMHPVHLELDVDGQRLHYSTPLVFIGVGERELKSPLLGSRLTGGKRCLHVLVVRERRAARLVALALEAARLGVERVARTPQLDSFLVDACRVVVRGRQRRVALDGEIVRAGMPLEYRLIRDGVTIVVP